MTGWREIWLFGRCLVSLCLVELHNFFMKEGTWFYNEGYDLEIQKSGVCKIEEKRDRAGNKIDCNNVNETERTL